MLKHYEDLSAKGFLKNFHSGLKWVCDMADIGVRETPEADDNPENNFLYMLKCDLQEIEKEIAAEQEKAQMEEADEDELL